MLSTTSTSGKSSATPSWRVRLGALWREMWASYLYHCDLRAQLMADAYRRGGSQR